MTRAVEEWIGANDDSQIPARVKVRVFDACGGACADCSLTIRGALRPAYDHKIAIINGGSNRESNLQLLCVPCHALKTKADVAEKALVYRKRAKHLGVTPKRKAFQSRRFPAVEPQHTASRPILRRAEERQT